MSGQQNEFILQRLTEIHTDMVNGFAAIQLTQTKQDEKAAKVDKRVALLEDRWKWVASGIVAAFAALLPLLHDVFTYFYPGPIHP